MPIFLVVTSESNKAITARGLTFFTFMQDEMTFSKS